MKKLNRFLTSILIFLYIIISNCQVYATNLADYFQGIQFSNEYRQYLELNEEEKEDVIPPKMYEVSKDNMLVTNPFKLGRMVRSSVATKFSLKDIIPENMAVKDQKQTNSCWTFSTLAALETNLAIKNWRYQLPTVVYDFSERHMEYATSMTFKNGVINEDGFKREVGDGGNNLLAIAYLTNGTGAISENDMKFENNELKVEIGQIQNKEVISQVIDTIDFPSYTGTTDDTTEIKQQMKDHITNYGGISALIYGASLSDTSCYNNETGAIYCNNAYRYNINHAVTIVGWDDNYSVENFVAGNRPKNNGAWIIRNSWGTGERYTLAEMKEYIFTQFPTECAGQGWTDATQIPDDFATLNFSSWGYTIENNVAILQIGDNGFMYISYEDVNVYTNLTGIINAQNEVTYDNIYQYDEYGGYLPIKFNQNKMYLATVFERQSSTSEYLTQVSINAAETYTCTVYVNPNGTSKAKSDLQKIALKSGATETFDAGYHTIEFLEPLKINSDKFVVVLEIQGKQTSSLSIMTECNFGEYFTDPKYANAANHMYDLVTVQTDKCFIATPSGMEANKWNDAGKLYAILGGKAPNSDTTIKAFTVSKILENISISTPPTKTSYVKGQNFDATGMVVKANYSNGTSTQITDYEIEDGTNLALGQTSVTISWNGKTVQQTIECVENTVERIEVKTPSNKTEYWAGEDFNKAGLIVQAVYKDGTRVDITDYTIKDGSNLKNNQTTITIVYQGLTTTQNITVKANPVEKIEITKAPNKVKYIAGQNYDPTGMKVKATYANQTQKDVTDFTVQNGTNLQKNQTSVTIEYEGKTATQEISVELKAVVSISVKTMPAKIEYIQNKEQLDLTGGVIEILYNDNSKEELSMTSEEITVTGFDNQTPGTITITLTYQNQTTQLNVEIKELAKPQNSNFSNMKGEVKTIKAYYFTDTNKKQYTIVDVELDNILQNNQNEKLEYYYYLSSSQEETGITNWVKIEDFQNSNGKMVFKINTADILNHQEVENADVLYLYIKEVATKNSMEKQEISSIKLEVEGINVEEFVDGEKRAEVNPNFTPEQGEEPDNTLAPGIIPNAGRTILIICSILAIIITGIVIFLKYNDIEIK